MSNTKEMIKNADKLFQEGYYKKAHDIYQSILNAPYKISRPNFAELNIKYDKCYLKDRKPWIEFGEENDRYSEIEEYHNQDGIRIYDEWDILDYGKFRGDNPLEVLETNPKYILWCIINVNWFCLHPEIMLDRNHAYMDEYLKALEYRILKLNFFDIYSLYDYDSERNHDRLLRNSPKGWEDALPPEEADIARLNTE